MVTFDVNAFTKNSDGSFNQSMITNNNGETVTGSQKLAQRFIIELMTPKGSLTYLLNRGTVFVSFALSGQLINEVDVYSAFSLALLDIKSNFAREDESTDPLDEQYSNALITNIEITSESLNLTIQVISKAGTSENIVLPLTFQLNG